MTLLVHFNFIVEDDAEASCLSTVVTGHPIYWNSISRPAAAILKALLVLMVKDILSTTALGGFLSTKE
ncbi:hypothetical protein CCR75_006718 [Bremia lactucae]|uniref:Uncharacterized protein n=1 Tax=Bremia lactucae TaxID=4779 RepID=A0A976NYW8_BRELC|nr:hypothetical protein CCR75_006718 [Bremia lactucae]